MVVIPTTIEVFISCHGALPCSYTTVHCINLGQSKRKKFARYRVPENGVSILVVLHVMRLVSWAELYLIVALLMSLWPKIKGLLLGKKQ
mmetsp:Transcript_27824/g.37207  ORF Transcript_27824/g.37207 Transcript_27824/m.37207 type:complete len:89 (+) Transcript_27824:1169-1435(+)